MAAEDGGTPWEDGGTTSSSDRKCLPLSGPYVATVMGTAGKGLVVMDVMAASRLIGWINN